jgi:hypothetical protein
MIPLRIKSPSRRTTPTKNPTGENWSEHKSDLREDFNNCCGYCDSFDGYRHTYFEVDHFIPKVFFKNNGNISLTQYTNLVYSCKFCNNAKSTKWPTQSEIIFNDGNIGFVDPCDDDYETHFYRTNDGGIMWNTNLGKWMFSEAFKFDERQHGIKVLWNLSRLQQIINLLAVVLNKYDDTTEDHRQIKLRIGDYCFEYFKFHQQLIDYYN